MAVSTNQLVLLATLSNTDFEALIERVQILTGLGYNEISNDWGAVAHFTHGEWLTLIQRLETLHKNGILKVEDTKTKAGGRKPQLMPNTGFPLNTCTREDLLREAEALGLSVPQEFSEKDLRLMVKTAIQSKETGI